MDKENLKKLVQDPRFISGIFNYCDRWCERCLFTARCLNFAMENEELDDPENHNLESEAFWEKIEKNLIGTIELLREIAEEQGIDLHSIDTAEIEQQENRSQEEAESHALSQSARRYSKMVDHWFKKNELLFEQRQRDMIQEMELGIEQARLINEAKNIIDATEVIRWYQHQMRIKIMRALQRDETDIEEDAIQNDSNGSAKVALIAMDRSIGAWGSLHELFPEQTDNILDILLHLDRLRKKTEATFPDARRFKRPGFDVLPLE
ncbi:MAG: hypothetical protein MUC94_04370 [bacterium]|nr:hypothetical protein [bacterium]